MSSSLARHARRPAMAAVAGLILATPSFALAGDPPLEATPAGASASPPTTGQGPPSSGPTPESAPPPAPLLSGEKGWQLGFFGWAEADGVYDTTQSLTDS